MIERLQAEAEQSPRSYRFKVAMLAMLGFGVLVLILLLALGLPVALVGYLLATGAPLGPELAFVLVMPLAFGGLVLRALWVRFDAPLGYRLRNGEAPELERAVERLRQAVGAPRLDGIVIDSELNAAAANVPRMLGLFGHRHYLVLGLPLMQLLDRSELAAVVAHEFGHFGERDGHFTGWIHRVRISWYRMLDALSASGTVMTRLLLKFFEWYVPYFNAYSFVLARGNEYQADVAAVRTTSAAVMASALIRMEVASQRLQRDFWPGLHARARSQARPPAHVHADMAAALQAITASDVKRVMAVAERDTDLTDTHPTLPQRVAAMSVTPALLPRVQSAAPALLGSLLPQIERDLDERWRKHAEADWRARHEAAAVDRARLAAIEARMSLTDDEVIQRAQLVEELCPDFDPLPLYGDAIARVPRNAMLHFRSGLLLLRRGDSKTGMARLRHAMELDAGALRPALARLREFEEDLAFDAATAAEMAALRMEFAGHARGLDARDAVVGEDRFVAHDLDTAALRTLNAALARSDRIGRAWLVRKRFDTDAEMPHYVLLVTWRGSVASESAGLKQVADAWALPGSFTVFTANDRKQIAGRVREVCGEPVYRKGRL